MSQSNPNPEERERIVNDVVKNKMSKRFMPPVPTDVDILLAKLNDAIATVRSLTNPIADASITNNHIHTKEGREAFLTTSHKLFLDYFKQFDRDECLFLLAFVHAKILLEQHA